MIKVLNITGILPHPDIKKKINENNIILETEDRLVENYSNIEFQHLFVLPGTNKFLSIFSKKWRSYYKTQVSKYFFIKTKKIFVVGFFQLPRKTFIRNILYNISFYLNMKLIKEIVSEFQPTIIHAQNTDVDAYLARRISSMYNIPYVVTLRGIGVSDNLVKINIEAARSLIALSPRQILDAQRVVNNRVNFIPHGITDSFFHIGEKETDNNSILKMVSVCRLLPLKKLDLVIKYLAEYKSKFIFDIYGDGPERDNLKSLIETHNLEESVTLKGFLEHSKLPDILPLYDVFVMPSIPETFGRVYFEAMASKLPVVASKATGIDGLIVDGKQGYLVNHNEKNSMREVLRLIEDRDRLVIMGQEAYNLAKQFSWHEILPKLYSIYTKDRL